MNTVHFKPPRKIKIFWRFPAVFTDHCGRVTDDWGLNTVLTRSSRSMAECQIAMNRRCVNGAYAVICYNGRVSTILWLSTAERVKQRLAGKKISGQEITATPWQNCFRTPIIMTCHFKLQEASFLLFEDLDMFLINAIEWNIKIGAKWNW